MSSFETSMIGVVADISDHGIVTEFFELFKTPWEFYRAGQKYDVVLCTTKDQFDVTAKLVLVYSGGKTSSGNDRPIQSEHLDFHTCILSYREYRIPIYGDAVTFSGKQSWLLKDEESQQPAAYLEKCGERVQIRIGYDLFSEVRRLLSVGQPVADAAIPTLDLHIALLRDLIVGCGIRLVEIPPVPERYRFIACLTHDVDHPSIRQHKCDHTILGFLYRSIFASSGRLFSGQITVRELIRNWLAALKLPLVYLGIAKDFWRDFDDRYLQLENGIPSTFFLIPFKNHSGNYSDTRALKLRAARYCAAELAETIDKLTLAGCEIGLHGIDAWCDSTQGRAELDEINRLTRSKNIGVRMHWLYYDQQSPAALEMAGATYDSTVGYNETVGYRAGTTQVYKPLEAKNLLELPLHVMDTALFYPAYLGLSPEGAKTALRRMADNAAQFGGCITINWHDRSLAPERLWGLPYCELIQDLKNRGAWFATAGQAVSWFKKRRSVTFEPTSSQPDKVNANIAANFEDNLPDLRLRIHNASESDGRADFGSRAYVEIAFQDKAQMPEMAISCQLT